MGADDTRLALEAALVAHLTELTPGLDGASYLGDWWVVAALPILDDEDADGRTRYVHFGNALAHHRAMGLLHTSLQLLVEHSSE